MPYYLGLSVLSNNPESRRGREGQKTLSAEARRILSCLADRPLAGDDMAADGQGRPFLPGSKLDFSISHSGKLAAVSLAKGGKLRTGCDVELVRPRTRMREITEEFFSASERDYIVSREYRHPGRPDETRFYEIWTLKECYIKLRGLSVFNMAEVPSFISKGRFAFGDAAASPLTFNLYDIEVLNEHYILAAAIEGAEAEQPEIRLFSQGPLSGRRIAKIN